MGRTRKWPEDGSRNLEAPYPIPELKSNCIMVGGSSSFGLERTAASYRTCHEPPKVDNLLGWRRRLCQWKGIAAVCVLFISVPVSSYLKDFHNPFASRGKGPQSSGQSIEMSISLDDENRPASPVWVWDHYLFNSQNATLPIRATDEFLESSRNLLLVQVVAAPHGSDLRACSMVQFSEISSRPNRAYARQWGRNFVRYTPVPPDDVNSQCDGVDHVVILNAILDRQQPRTPESADSIPYDALVLLPPDAIITDLDYDLLAMLPENKLLSFVGPQRRQQQTGEVVFWNLRHELTHEVALRLWNAMMRPSEDYNDRSLLCDSKKSYIDLLLNTVLPSVVKDGNVRSLVGHLDETSEGFVFVNSQSASSEIDPSAKTADPMPCYCLKCLPSPGSSSKASQLLAHPDATGVTLQTTADAVCYRYYPKCEVL